MAEPTIIGPHLLGRIPSPPDERDYRLENFRGLGASTAASDAAALVRQGQAELKLTQVSFPKWAASTYPDVKTTHWWKALDALQQAVNLLDPPAPPPSGVEVWANPRATLDQGNYGTCVGNGSAQWGNTSPVNDSFDETAARAIYFEATKLDGSPDDPDAPGGGQQGATVRSGVKALQARGRLSTYAQATTLSAIKSWLQTKGSLIVGSDWLADMFDPDAQNYVHVTGSVEGGHCYLLIGYHPATDSFEFLNSWGPGWGANGHFLMHSADFQKLLSSGGEAWTAVELAL